jgi:hypothetical protein
MIGMVLRLLRLRLGAPVATSPPEGERPSAALERS